MQLSKQRLQQIILEEVANHKSRVTEDDQNASAQHEAFYELGLFNAKLINQGYDDLADELGHILVKLQRLGLAKDLREGDDHSRTVTQVETIGDIVSDAIKESDNPEVVERLERADQLVTALLKKLQGIDEPSFDSSGYSKVSGQRPMQEDSEPTEVEENFENDQQLSDSKEDVLRQIVAQGQRAKVQGSMVDLFSAGAIVTVLDALSPENKKKYLDFHPYKMAEIAFKLTK